MDSSGMDGVSAGDGAASDVNDEQFLRGYSLNKQPGKKTESRTYTGIPASPGIAIGHAFIYDEANLWINEKNIAPEDIDREKQRLRDAVGAVIKDIKALRYRLEQQLGEEEASIFDPHIMLLQDPAVIKETDNLIESGKNAEFAFFRTTRNIIKIYKRVDDEYLRQRIDDFTDILRRVYTKLQGKEFAAFSNIKHPVIVVAPNLSPSDTANMHTGSVLAFVTDVGGITSHATILARSMGIPAVLGVHTASSEIGPGDLMIVDGTVGVVYVNPDPETVEKYTREKADIEKYRIALRELRDIPAVTLDGKTISLQANIEFPDEVESLQENGAEGVGLYRSEFNFLKEDRIPTEDELYEVYSTVVESLAPKPVIIRTFDLGGDKISHTIQTKPEENPFLGWRAIRVSLALKDVFKVHLRAILRASNSGNVKIMFPMISSMQELTEALECVEEAKNELRALGIGFDENIPVGIMIEIPSAVMIADHLARRVSFFSIGTNDLTQYAVAVDRTNDRIAALFDPFHPGVLKLLKITVDAGHAQGIHVAVCGEMSNDPLGALVLVGLGIDELSMAPSYIPPIKRLIRSVNARDLRETAEKVLTLATGADIRQYLEERFNLLIHSEIIDVSALPRPNMKGNR